MHGRHIRFSSVADFALTEFEITLRLKISSGALTSTDACYRLILIDMPYPPGCSANRLQLSPFFHDF